MPRRGLLTQGWRSSFQVCRLLDERLEILFLQPVLIRVSTPGFKLWDTGQTPSLFGPWAPISEMKALALMMRGPWVLEFGH